MNLIELIFYKEKKRKKKVSFSDKQLMRGKTKIETRMLRIEK